jgi:hypothetical protein
MINTNRIARGLLDWIQDGRPVVDRATLLPIGQYEDGSLTLAWPGFLKDAAEGAQRSLLDAARAPVPDAPTGTRWASNIDALNAAGLAPMAGLGMRAAGMAGGAARLPMDDASRLARARDLGFDTSRPLFHGTDKTFDAFDISKARTSTEPAVFFSPDLEVANAFGPNVVEAFVRPGRQKILTKETDPDLVPDIFRNEPIDKKFIRYDRHKFARAIEDAKAQGYDSVVFKGVVDPMTDGMADQVAVFNPRDIRSIHAAFDPAKADSALLLAANDANASLPALFDYVMPPGGLLAPPEEPPLPGLLAYREPFGPKQIPRNMQPLTYPWDAKRPDWDIWHENLRERWDNPVPPPVEPPQDRRRFFPIGMLNY